MILASTFLAALTSVAMYVTSPSKTVTYPHLARRVNVVDARADMTANDSVGKVVLAAAADGYKPPPPRYIGSVYCYACHQDLALEFAQTKMGKLFLVKPTNDLERKGCEGCHGPGSDHAESGGGLGIGGLIEFRIDQGQSINTANQACLECHDEAFWHGRTGNARRMACFDCHVVMVRESRQFQLASAADEGWNNSRTWGTAALAGLLVGVVLGGWRWLEASRSRRMR
jgi:hypothetical protein